MIYFHRTILLGVGVLGRDWEEEHKKNKMKLYIIEPVVESLLQVTCLLISSLQLNNLI